MILFILVFCGAASASNGTWHNQSLDKITVSGGYTSIAMDSSGNPHISYYDDNTKSLKYIYKSGNVWHNETVDTGNVGRYSSLALDSKGNPFISYADYTNHALKLAFKYSGSWYIQTLSTDGGSYTSIALDSNNTPHISFSNGFKLEYAAKTFNGWNITTVDSSNTYVGTYNSLKLDSSGKAYISYYDESNPGYDLKFASLSNGKWTIKKVDTTGDVGAFSSLALDSSGNPHISYYDTTNKRLKYASRSGNTWTFEIPDTGNVGKFTSLVLDSNGNPHISYYDNTKCDLKYAYKSGGVWHNETVDNTWTVGNYNSIALDSSGNPSISYAGGGYADLRYAYFTPNIPPVVSSIDPKNNAVSISPSKVIKITFNKTIKQGNMAIELKKSGGNDISITESIVGNILTIKHTSALVNGKYSVYLHTGCVTDMTGTPIAIYSSSFTVDSIPPKVKTTDPVNNAVKVATNKIVKITFNEPIKAGNKCIQIVNSKGTVISTTTSINGSVLTINHSKLAKTTKYTVILHTGCITDIAGNKLALYTTKFTTA